MKSGWPYFKLKNYFNTHPKQSSMRITGTFLDEISHDIPHQNWSEKEWELDFQYMKAVGI
jgi:hypothetical protein